jgi:tripartite-type tricarboxylate transporter receptor subunit TctC
MEDIVQNLVRRMALLLGLALGLGAPLPAAAQYPNKPIRLVLQFPAGGIADAVARIVAQPLSQALGQPVIVENRPGADGAIAGETVMKAAPDGYTLLLATNSTLSAVPTLRKNPPYDPVNDFAPISMVGRFSFFAFTHPGVSANTLAEFVKHARANPGKLNYGTGNTTSILATAQFKSLAGIDMVQVPYKGDAPATTDLLGGRVDLVIASTVPGLALAKEGKIRALATLLARRSSHLPDVPTMAEAGFPEYSVTSWAAIFGPAKLPRPIVERLTREINAILQRPEVKEQLDRQAFETEASTPEALGAFVKDQLEVWRRAVREAGIAQE